MTRFITMAIVLLGIQIASADTITFAVDGKKNIECTCIVAKSGCKSKVFDVIGGGERYTWVQELSVTKGMHLDLNEVCYRKRDVDRAGEGKCCISGNERETIKEMFRGKVQ